MTHKAAMGRRVIIRMLYETGSESARRAADVIGTAKKITDALQTSVRLRKLAGISRK